MTTPSRPSVLLVDHRSHSLVAMQKVLGVEFDCLTAQSIADAEQKMEEGWVQVVVCSQLMPDKTGVGFLMYLRDRWPDTVRVIITGDTDSTEMARMISEAGIQQAITQPWSSHQLVMAVRNGVQLFQLARENERMALEMRFLSSTVQTKLDKRRAALREGMGFETLLREPDSPMSRLIDKARHFATFDVPVVISGEPGTGKGRLARAIHYGSLRSDKPFYAFNLAGLTDDLVMVALFGAKRGVLPGGVGKIGLVQKADRGTLYLEAVDTASPAVQLALWRLVEEGVYSPVGGQEAMTTNIRLIAGVGLDTARRVQEGSFRSDLYYALSVTELCVPPLRERRGDVAVLAHHFLTELAEQHGKTAHGFTETAIEFLVNYCWPGNLAELRNEVTRMLIFSQSPVLGAELISRAILQAVPGQEESDGVIDPALAVDGTLKERVEMIEMRVLRETLTRHRWNKSRAATELGLSRVGLRAKLERYDIIDPSERVFEEED